MKENIRNTFLIVTVPCLGISSGYQMAPEADSEEGKLQGTNAGGQVRAAPVDVAAAMPSTDWERQVWGWGRSGVHSVVVGVRVEGKRLWSFFLKFFCP